MELYKAVNGRIKKFNGGFVVIDNMIYTNPTEENIKRAGYKPKIIDEQPEYDIKTQFLRENIEDTEDNILVHWEICLIENIEF